MAAHNTFLTSIKKRTFLEAFGKQQFNNSIFKQTLKSGIAINSEVFIPNYKKFSEE